MLKRMKQMKVKKLIALFSSIIAVLLIVIAVLLFFVFDEEGEKQKADENSYNDAQVGSKNIIVFEAETMDGSIPSDADMKFVQDILRNRLDYLGYSEGTVGMEGDNRFLVGLPEYDPEVVEILGQTAELTFNYAALDADGNMIPGEVVLTGTDVEKAEAANEPVDSSGESVCHVVLSLTGEGQRKFAEATATAAKKSEEGTNVLFICLDGNPISWPYVDERIDSNEVVITLGQMTGEEASQKASELASLINSGRLPLKLVEAENR
ncbi:MAG: hypothetical protein IJO09_10160 [Oscillospiraceae bacterium]|nr:hypothetical protein [Oscillospiraceae bacterium]